MPALLILLLAALTFPMVSVASTDSPAAHMQGTEPTQNTKAQAETQALIGRTELRHDGRLGEARAACDAALKLDPTNSDAKECLDWVASMTVESDLSSASNKLLIGDKSDAALLVSKWVNSGASEDQRKRAREILHRAQAITLRELSAKGFWKTSCDWVEKVWDASYECGSRVVGRDAPHPHRDFANPSGSQNMAHRVPFENPVIKPQDRLETSSN